MAVPAGPPAADPAGAAAPGWLAGSEPAPLGRRLGALLADWLLCVLVSALFADPRTSGWPPVAVLVAANIVFIGLFGQTPGMYLTRLRCLSYADGGAIGLGRALVRAVLLVLIIPPAVMDGLRRGLHDRAAGSIVVLASPRR
jgi:RDD family